MSSTAIQTFGGAAANMTGTTVIAQTSIASLRERPTATPRRSRLELNQPPEIEPTSART